MSRTPLPDPGPEALREYVPALRYAVRLAKQREREHRRSVEAVGWVVARRHRRDLEALREVVEGTE